VDDRTQQITAFIQARGLPLLRLARLLARDPSAAEDLFQEALVRCIPRWDKIEEDPEGYVRRTLVHVAIDHGRRRARRPERLGEPPEQATADGAGVIDARLQLLQVLRQLPPRQRAAIVLRYWEDHDERSTALLMGCSVGTVKSLTSRGLARARELVGLPEPTPRKEGAA
jgi:RNA polymerase sigma-70 factor (sigma-E family)